VISVIGIKRNKLVALCTLVLLSVLVSACITTTESVFTEQASPEKALERRVELARQYIGEGNWPDAKRNLRLANDIDPKNPEVHEAFALVYQSTGEFELAEESFKTALKLDRKFSRARNNYAAFLYSQGRFQEAEAHLQTVVGDTLYAGRPRAFLNLGLCRVRLFDPHGAEEAFARALSMDRTNAIALLELAHLRFDADDFVSAGKYYGTYRSVVRQQSARGLWLGIRLAGATGDRDAEGSYALALSNLYPNSVEFQAYQRTRQSD
jgi:type IV pilus assembly protein PilF